MKGKQLYTGILLLIFVMLNADQAQGQQIWDRLKKHLVFAEEYDENVKFKIGIYLGGIHSNYVFEKNKDWNTEGFAPGSTPDIGTFTGIESKAGPGFSLGIPFDYRFNPHLNLSLTPGFLIATDHKLQFSGNGQETSAERMQQVDPNMNFPVFELPLHMKVRSDKKYFGHNPNPYSLYLLGGAKYSNLLGVDGYYEAKSSTRTGFDPGTTDVPIIVKPEYFSYELGIGLDIYFTYFKFSPEIRFSQSLGDLMDKKRTFPPASGYQNPFMNALDRLSLRSLQISLIFE